MSFQSNPLPQQNKPVQTTTTIDTSNPDKTKICHKETYNTTGVSTTVNDTTNDTLRNENWKDRNMYNTGVSTTLNDTTNDTVRTENWKDRNMNNTSVLTTLNDPTNNTVRTENWKDRNTYNTGVSTTLNDTTNDTVRTENWRDQDKNYSTGVSTNVNDTTNDTVKKEHRKDVHKKDRKMDVLLNNACDMLAEVFNKNVYPDNRIPLNLFQSCKGVMFLRIWKAGIGIGGMGGSGIVMAHNNQIWSQPCAVTLGGIQIGVNLGVERVDDVLLLRDDSALRLFSEKGHFKLGLDASIAMGDFGVDTNTSIAMGGNETKSIYAYSFAKGVFFGISLDGGVLSIDDKLNEEYYGAKVGVKDIFSGNVVAPQNNSFVQLQQLLNSYSYGQDNVVTVTHVEKVNPVM